MGNLRQAYLNQLSQKEPRIKRMQDKNNTESCLTVPESHGTGRCTHLPNDHI